MGNPLDHLATQVDLVGELFRLTEGGPAAGTPLCGCPGWARDRSRAYVRAAELQTLQPRLHGYFDRWWDEQHQRWTHAGRAPLVEQEQLRTLLNAVAAALGPLTHSDLAAVSPLTNGLLVRRLAQTISRWLIGDGKSHGYTFSHPRLGYYFWELLGATEQADWDARFTGGATTLAALHSGAVAPRAAPRYLVQHYAAHLTCANAPAAQFYAFLEWTRTLHQLSQRPRPQFLHDIQSLMPFILALADEEAPQAATGIFQALQDVCGWRP